MSWYENIWNQIHDVRYYDDEFELWIDDNANFWIGNKPVSRDEARSYSRLMGHNTLASEI